MVHTTDMNRYLMIFSYAVFVSATIFIVTLVGISTNYLARTTAETAGAEAVWALTAAILFFFWLLSLLVDRPNSTGK